MRALFLIAALLCAACDAGAGRTASVPDTVAYRSPDGSPASAPLARGTPVEVVLPDQRAEVRAFRAQPPEWSETLVNAASGLLSRVSQRRQGFWQDPNRWLLYDYVDRSGNLGTQRFLEHRGVFAEFYGHNEYQETIHFHEEAALALFGENGIARGLRDERVMDPFHNASVKPWAAKHQGNAWIVDNNAPRWSAVILYDWLTSPLFGDAISQDNLGGPTSRIGPGASGRYDRFNERKFRDFLARVGEDRASALLGNPPSSVREYAWNRLGDAFRSLPPYDQGKKIDFARARVGSDRIARDPVLSAYQRFQYVSHVHNVQRYYAETRTVASRSGRPHQVHGNMGGFFPGVIPYSVALADSVDAIWFEASGLSQFDQFRHGWVNAWGPFRLALGESLSRGRKPVMFLTQLRKVTRDLLAHEWAEVSAGGGIALDNPLHLQRAHSSLVPLLEDHLRLRDEHRAVFERRGRRPWAQVGIVYSVPSLMYRQYVPSKPTVAIPPINDLSGAVRAMEEGHVPYEVVRFDHPDMTDRTLTAKDLRRFSALVLPSVENVSDAHLELLRGFVAGGGRLIVLGDLAAYDEDNHPRAAFRADSLGPASRILRPLRGDAFTGPRTRTSARVRARIQRMQEALRKVVPDPIVAGRLPPLVWIKTWLHDDDALLSAHLVNYDVDYESGRATPVEPLRVRLRVPAGMRVQTATWLVPGEPARTLPVQVRGNHADVAVPGFPVYGVLVLGPEGRERSTSGLRLGDRRLLRAEHAGRTLDDTARGVARVRALRRPAGAQAFAAAAGTLLREIAQRREQQLLDAQRALMDPGRDVVLALDVGGKKASAPWQALAPDTSYDARRGFGWLAPSDASRPTPEEGDYLRSRDGNDPDALTAQWMKSFMWPHDASFRAPPLQRAVYSGRARRLRLDVPKGRYQVELIATNPGWGKRNLLVSGMTRAQGRFVLLDTPLDLGEMRRRSFPVEVAEAPLVLEFGGPTGFGLAAVVIRRATAEGVDPLEAGALRSWWLSARHPDPEWWPIEQTRAAPERDPASPETRGWTAASAPTHGIPVVDLGTTRDAEVGDVVYALHVVERDRAGEALLSVGASSAARVWVNGTLVSHLPNLKGVMRDEARIPIQLRAGRNTILIKLARFWERRWMFYASLLPG